jgi:hypothetical protein
MTTDFNKLMNSIDNTLSVTLGCSFRKTSVMLKVTKSVFRYVKCKMYFTDDVFGILKMRIHFNIIRTINTIDKEVILEVLRNG